MARFLIDEDYETLVKEEIRRLLDGRAPDGTGTPVKLLKAEQMAVQQVRNWLSERYDMDTAFAASGDARDHYLVMIVIDLTLYHLYSQTGHKDVPEHRDKRYTDALDWLKNAGRGQITTDLPTTPQVPGEETVVDFRLSSDEQENHKY